MRSDQLTNLMARGMIFDGFREALWPPPFLPTYKCKMRSSKATHSNSLPRQKKKKKKNMLDTSFATRDTLQEAVHQSAESQSNSSNSSSPTSQSVDSSASSITTSHSNSTIIAASNNKTTANSTATSSTKLLKKSSSFSRSVPLNLNSLSDEEEEEDDDDEDVISSSFNTSRVPSFTDRVLYQARLAMENGIFNGGGNGINLSNHDAIHCLAYNAIRSVDSSDHKPVRALFEVALDSGGPRVPLRLKKRHLNLITQNANNLFFSDRDESGKSATKQKTSESSNVLSSSSSEQILPTLTGNPQANGGGGTGVEHNLKQSMTTGNISSFFGRRLGKKGRQKRKEFKLQQQQDRLLHGSVSMSSLPTAAAALGASLDSKLTRLNAGAFERQVFIDGLRLRNSLASTINQNRETTSLLADERLKAPKFGTPQQKSDTQSQNIKRSLFKSKSFDSNVDAAQATVIASTSVVVTPPLAAPAAPALPLPTQRQRPQSEPVSTKTVATGDLESGSMRNGTATSKNTSIGNSNSGPTSQDNLSKFSSICSIA